MRSLIFLIRKEFLQIRRDRTILGMLFMMPIVQLLILANAATFEVRHARMFVVDRDHSTASRALVDRLTASGRFVPVGASPSTVEADEAIMHRRADLIVVVPAGFDRDLVRERRATVQLILNAEDGAAAGVMQAYAAEILARYSAELRAEVSASPATGGNQAEIPHPGSATIDLRRRGWYNAELEYRDYMVPGILVVLVTLVGTLLTAMNIVREKETGTLDQLNVTPVTRATFIAAKLIPLWSLALLVLSIGLVVARLAFQVPMRGNLVLVFVSAGIYLVVALGIGLWVSTVVETQQQAMFVTYSILMIYLLMSGLFTPVRGMPSWAQWPAQLNPVLHFVHLMRAVLLKGAGVQDVARQLAVLAVSGVVVLTLAVRQYSKRAG